MTVQGKGAIDNLRDIKPIGEEVGIIKPNGFDPKTCGH
jgi:hypothetical protein